MAGHKREQSMTDQTATQERPLHVIAADIRKNWKNVYFGAKPYLDAMATMQTPDQNYIADSGTSVVLYFLGNAQNWRGEDARRIKAELKGMMNRRGIKW